MKSAVTLAIRSIPASVTTLCRTAWLALLVVPVALAADLAQAQQATPVPASAFTVESWMTAGSISVQSPTSALVGQSASGFRWDVSVFTNSGNSPAVFNSIKSALANGGSLDYTIRFDPSLIVAPGSQPTFIGVNSFYQTGDVASNFVQNYNTPVLGSSDFPLTGERTFNVSLPIKPWTGTNVPGNGTGDVWLNPDGGWFKIGFGLNFDNASSAGFYLDNVTVNAVPEPSSLGAAGLGMAALGGLAFRRLRKRPAGTDSTAT